MNLVDKAAYFAMVAHAAAGNKRKYTNDAYHHHTVRVAQLVREMSDNLFLVAAAHLHDVVEDTFITHQMVEDQFGLEISQLVFELTDQFVDPLVHGNRAKRKAKECDRLSEVSVEAKTIKLADLIDNTSSIVEHDPKFARVYLQEKQALLEVLTGAPEIWLDSTKEKTTILVQRLRAGE